MIAAGACGWVRGLNRPGCCRCDQPNSLGNGRPKPLRSPRPPMAPPMNSCDSGTLCVVVPWLVPDVWQPSAASGVSRLSKGARFYSGMLRAALAATSWACAGLKSRPGI